MVTEFKSREQLVAESKIKFDKQLNEMLKENPGLQTERLIRLIKGEELEDDRLYISNGLVKLKFGIRKVYKRLDDFCIPEINKVQKILDDERLSQSLKEDYKKYLAELNQYKDDANSYLMKCGSVIIDSFMPMLDKYFTEHEIIQIIGGSYEQAKRIKEYYDKHNTGTRSLTDSFIMHHIEYRWRKGRSKDYLTCPRWEMPLFECASTYVWDVINSDSKAKADMDRAFRDIFSDNMIYVTKDSQGNIISAEKVIQELTINELIKDYQGPFINQLKQQNTFDNKTTYKIKRVDAGIYDVITEDKEVLARIYKKHV